MGTVKRGKKGITTLGFLVSFLLIIVSAIIIITVIYPIFTSEFTLDVGEVWCKISLGLKDALQSITANTFNIPIAACSTERLVLDSDLFKKSMKEGDTFEEGGMRYIFDRMRRCKFIVGGDSDLLFSNNQCYICYTFKTEKDVSVVLTQDDFYEFSLNKRIDPLDDESDVYLKDLQSPEYTENYHLVVVNPKGIIPGIEYAIVYADPHGVGGLALGTMLGGGCLLGAKGGGFFGPVGAVSGCVLGAGIGGATLIDDFFKGTNANIIMLVELDDLRSNNAKAESPLGDESGNFKSNKITCGGYVY